MKLRSILLAASMLLAPIAAQAQVTTTLAPIAVTLVQQGQVPTGTQTTVTVSCQNLAGITGGQTQQATFAGPGTVVLQFPVTAATNCTFSGADTFVVGGLPRTGPVPVTQATTAIATVVYPAVTVKSVVFGDGPATSTFSLACSTNGVTVPLNPAVFNGQFNLSAGQSRTFGRNDITGLTTDSRCEARLLTFGANAVSYASTTGTSVINGQVVDNQVLGGVVVAGNFQSALTQANGQTITVTQAYPVKPTVPATTTTVAPTTTVVTTTTTTLPPATVPATTTTALPVVSAAPPVAVVVEPSFTG